MGQWMSFCYCVWRKKSFTLYRSRQFRHLRLDFMNETFEKILKTVRKYTSPTFLMLLGFSFLLWLLINMGHTYVATVTVPVRIENTRVKVKCEVEGTGYRIFAHRILRRSDIKVRFWNVDTSASATEKDMLVVNPSSLMSVIAANTKDLRIISVLEVPEIPAPKIGE